jgi:FkbH-like protein
VREEHQLLINHSEVESALAHIWCEVLGVQDIGLDDNFFEMGGDSLLALDLISRVRASFEVELPLMAFFEEPTVCNLASTIEGLRQEMPDAARIVRGPRDDDGALPLSSAQQRFWLLQEMDRSSYVYNEPRAARIRGKLDTTALEQSLNEIYRRHDVLRAIVRPGTDGPVQMIGERTPLRLMVDDLTSLDSAEREEAAMAIAVKECQVPFDLFTGPLLRARLLRLDSEVHILTLVMHHLITDGHTGGIVLDELGLIYNAITTGRKDPLPALTAQYADYALWEQDRMKQEGVERELSYWRTQMQGAPATLHLPTDHTRPQAEEHRGRLLGIDLDVETSAGLERLAQQSGATLFHVMLAGLRILLYHWTGQEDFSVGTVASNRSRPETERMVGCFINFLPLRERLTAGEQACDLLERSKQSVMNAFAHQECSFDKIVEVINPERLTGINPIYNVALLMRNFPEICFRGESFEAKVFKLDTEVSLLDLRFIVSALANGLRLECEFKTSLFKEETIRQLLHAYMGTLQKLIFDPKLPVGDFAISQQLTGQAAEARKREEKLTIAIAATFTAEPLDEPLKFWTGELAIPAVMKFAPYHQLFQQLLDPYSLMRNNQSGFNVVLVRMEDWTRYDAEGTGGKMQKIMRSVEELIAALESAGKQTGAAYLVCLCPASRALRGDGEWCEFLTDMEAQVVTRLGDATGVYVITSAEIEDLYPVAEYEDEYADKLGHVPYSAEFFAALSTMIVRRISSLRGPEYKVVVLDCDQTLWKGVCGEDRAMGVVVDPARRALQEFMLKQRDAGKLLCLCSKNNEEDVWEVFEQNPGMLLRREDIAGFRINWKPKSENLRALAEQLTLGLDSFAFVDDSAVECAEVEAGCPEVLALQMPAESEQWQLFLKHVWAFDKIKVTAEDRRRTGLYRENAEREQSRGESQSFDDFIASLELNVEIRPMEAEHLARTSQLTQRTNQFNCTTIRRDESEIVRTISAGAQCLIVNLRDRFGDYGLIGVLIYEIRLESLVVDTMLLSCRALGRRVEHTMLARLAAIAQEHGLEWVDVRFAPTAKNMPAAEFLDEIEGAQKIEAGHDALYRIPTFDIRGANAPSFDPRSTDRAG